MELHHFIFGRFPVPPVLLFFFFSLIAQELGNLLLKEVVRT